MGNDLLEQLNPFICLGSKIIKDNRSKVEVGSRIAQARSDFNKKKRILTPKSNSLEIREIFLEACVWSVGLYGCETWAVRTKQ